MTAFYRSYEPIKKTLNRACNPFQGRLLKKFYCETPEIRRFSKLFLTFLMASVSTLWSE